MKLEARPYGPGSTPEEVEAIAERVYLYEPGIVMYFEVPVPSTFQLDIFEKRLNEIGDDRGYKLLIDLTEAQPPGAAVRERLRRLFGGQGARLQRAAVYTGKNFMLNIAAKFVLGGIGLKEFSVHKTLEEALAAVKDVR